MLLLLRIWISTFAMSDQNAIRVLTFSGNKGEWAVWSERFLAKARRHRYKDSLLRKFEVPNSNEVIDDQTGKGKAKLKILDYIELAYTELILSTDMKKSSGRVVFLL